MPTRLQRSRDRAFQSQCGRCYYCNVLMWLHVPEELGPFRVSQEQAARLRCTAEHLHPESEGGSDRLENIAAACAHCNHTRHKRKVPPQPEAYRSDVRRRVGRRSWHHRWVFQFGLLPDLASREPPCQL